MWKYIQLKTAAGINHWLPVVGQETVNTGDSILVPRKQTDIQGLGAAIFLMVLS